MAAEPVRPASSHAGTAWVRRHGVAVQRLVLVGVALVPFLASNPGRVTADSRQYLYLDPGSFLGRATSLWDTSFAAGTVPHQHLGFLWPMGPWFWSTEALGIPMWIGQRLWLAGVAALAGIGMLQLARRTGLGATAAMVAALAYQLTPYQLAFTARLSVLLLPWAALPWLVLLARRSIVEGSWQAPVAFGLVASTAGAANASSLLLVLLGPAVVLGVASVGGEARAACAAALRIALVTAGASAWWLAGLVVQGRYGLPVLQLTENVDTVAAASTADDVVRGLGNWIFTSTDGAATAIDQAAPYSDSWVVRSATIALPAAAVAGLILVRFRGRSAVAAMFGLATVVGVGSAPLSDPSVYGRVWRRFAQESSIGLALRNTPRVVPVLVLATAYALAVGLDRLRGRARLAGAGAAAAVILVAIGPVATSGFLSDDFDRPEHLPDHWSSLAADLDRGPGEHRVLELPGANFAVYDWGNTVEPVLPGLIDRPTLAREVLPAGGAGTADLLAALDRRVQLGTLDPRALAPVARLLGVGDIVVRGDLDRERFGLTDPTILIERYLVDPPPGTEVTGRYGGTEARPALLRLTVSDAVPRLRAVGGAPTLLAGNGDGIVDAAAAGLIDGRSVVLQSATTGPAAEADALTRGADVIVTDTNRKRATTFFYTITDDVGATETAEGRPADPTGYDVRFGPFAESPTSEKTVARQLGGTVSASLEGGPERPEHRAVHAFDGDPRTSWQPRFDPVGQRVEADFDVAITADVVSVRTTPGDARVTSVALFLDGRRVDVDLDDRARTDGGQPVPVLDPAPFASVALEITGVDGSGPVGIAEISVDDAVVDEVLQTPDGLLRRTAEDLPGHALHYVLTRDRGDLADAGRAPVERDIDRFVDVVAPASFTLRGTVAHDAGTAATCRDDVVTVDGRPVPVRLEGSSLRSCVDLSLGVGSHRVRTARDGSVSVDQLVMSTGRPNTSPASGVELEPGSSSMRHVSATVVAPSRPFWLVLSESQNDGWELSVAGGTAVTATMVDGYANGWLIRPEGTGVLTVDLRWTPQRIVWTGMATSALTVLACAIVLVGGRRRARPHPVSLAPHARAVEAGPVVRWAALVAVPLVAWVIGGPVVAGVSGLAFAVRLGTDASRQRLIRIVTATTAAAGVVAAELTDRPSLVFLALGLLLAGVAADSVRGSQPSTTTSTSAPG